MRPQAGSSSQSPSAWSSRDFQRVALRAAELAARSCAIRRISAPRTAWSRKVRELLATEIQRGGAYDPVRLRAKPARRQSRDVPLHERLPGVMESERGKAWIGLAARRAQHKGSVREHTFSTLPLPPR